MKAAVIEQFGERHRDLEKASDVLASLGGYDTVAMSVITDF